MSRRTAVMGWEEPVTTYPTAEPPSEETHNYSYPDYEEPGYGYGYPHFEDTFPDTPEPTDQPTQPALRDTLEHWKAMVQQHWQNFSRRQRVMAAATLAMVVAATALWLVPRGEPSVQVARTLHPVNSGSVIDEHDVEWVTVPPELLPQHPVTTERDFHQRRVVGDIGEGELLTTTRLSVPSVPPGWRALSLPVGGESSWQPGQHVDVVVSSEDETHVVSRDARIHDSGNAVVGAGGRGYRSVVVALPEQDAYKLAQLEPDAVVTLMLR